MTLTLHGHHISGTTIDDEPIVPYKQACGGPGYCLKCTEDELTAFDTKGAKQQ